ncbi:Tetratricopeptide repeat-containing protein [Asanoa hainanensis]|uniref:Tetratricopeptide repeat-containing protein n=1 Tax=Asanoa hainanensis TaxID=560556 RepID=A0A239PHN9_9ACTN|nr:tetratricopeptide repeat protein [Asanoa hainanensis]SNT66315.1 Tetratricopeptide repeat-containing protein [Asanoa hainanensis]
MTHRLLIDLADDGRVAVSAWADVPGVLPELTEPFALDWTVEPDDLEELRWYLEDYLRAPYGVYQEQGERVAARLAEWGTAAFAAVFGGSGAARDAYVRLRDRGGTAEIVVRSAVAERLGLPWELLRDPARPTPLALDGVRIRRALPTAELAGTFAVDGERLRVLMVISRPAGDRDVGYRMVARPLLQTLEAVRGEVDLVVLRPPTLERLREVLAQAREQGQPFQVVHFDGHGSFSDRRRSLLGGAPDTLASAEQGVLVFERPGGGEDRVPADQVATVLGEAKVPVVVLNACQSGALGRQLETAIATRLLQQGAAAVVAMAFSVYAVAAAEFMAAFYAQLFAGGQVADAVAAGRRRLAERDQRPSPKGPLPLQDWLVPVLYARQDVSFPRLRAQPADREVSLGQILDEVRQRPQASDQDDVLAPVGGFVGRDGLFYELEVAARLQKVVLLHGAGGSGKTEFAKAFGRWWRDTGGVDHPQWVIWHSFEPGIASFGLTGVINAVGLQVFGPDFARLDDEQLHEAVLKVMHARRILLIWDNFESAHTTPDPSGATPALNETERERLAEFLAAATRTSSTVVITSRSAEQWLGDLRRIEVVGLSAQEADEYTDALLAPYPRASARRRHPAFADLMSWLGGHPLTMRLVLPHLDTADAAPLLASLRETGEHVLGDEAHGRTHSLAAGIEYSYRHLTADEQRALTAVSLFHGVADTDVLGMFSTVDGVPERFGGHTVEGWDTLLTRATDLGLFAGIGGGMYSIHPALPAFLSARWRDQEPIGYDEQRAAAELGFLDAYAAFAGWLLHELTGGDAGFASTLVRRQRHSLGAMLGFGLSTERYDRATVIAQVLTRHWNASGLHEEAREWTDRVQHATETADGRPPELDSPAGRLWILMVGAQANRQRGARLGMATSLHQLGSVAGARGELDAAEGFYRQSLAIEEEVGNRPGMAISYHQLGMVVQQRGELEAADGFYRQSLAIEEQVGNRPGMAASYHQLGMVAQQRGELDAAEGLYQKSLAIEEQVGNLPGVAGTYHELGTVAKARGDLDAAESWYQKSLAIREQLGNRPGMALAYQQLGVVAHARGELEVADGLYRKSLAIKEQVGNRPGMANSCHQLGLVAQQRGELEVAGSWYEKTLAIQEQLGDRTGMAMSCYLLGQLAKGSGRANAALEWTVRAVSLVPELLDPTKSPVPGDLADLTAELGWASLRQTWQLVTGKEIPEAVVRTIKASQDEGKPT